MFAVPGWSLSPASLQTQKITVQHPSKPSTRDADGETQEKDHKTTKKRKRSRDKAKANGVVVDSENFAELWAKYIEGKGVSGTSTGAIKSSKKRRKTDSTRHLPVTEVRSTGQGMVQVGAELPGHQTSKSKKDENKQPEANAPKFSLPNKSELESDGKSQTPDADKSPKKSKKLKVPRHKKTGPNTTQQSLSTDTPNSALPSSIKPASLPATEPIVQAPQAATPTTKLTPLQASMRSKLTSARFRHLNQTLYTTPSSASLTLFSQDPSMFADYHAGFRQQVSIWPSNPVDGYISAIKARGSKRPAHLSQKKSKPGEKAQENEKVQPLPRTDGTCVIADLGCGDGRLATSLAPTAKKLKLKILSFDLLAENENITKADIAHLPLENGAVDIAIFCLALMGTNWIDFIEEAWRVLRWKGELWVAEIKSRFGRIGNEQSTKRVQHSVGNKKKHVSKADKNGQEAEFEAAELAVEVDGAESGKKETDVSAFVEVLKRRGFVLHGEEAVDMSNKMFVKMGFVKALTPVKGKCVPEDKSSGKETWQRKAPKSKFLDEGETHADEGKVLKPCVYKIR